MKGFLFFSKVGFILNLVFFVCVFFWFLPTTILPQGLTSLLIVAGWPLSLAVNTILFMWLIGYLFLVQANIQPRWMVIFNTGVFIFQLIFFFL